MLNDENKKTSHGLYVDDIFCSGDSIISIEVIEKLCLCIGTVG